MKMGECIDCKDTVMLVARERCSRCYVESRKGPCRQCGRITTSPAYPCRACRGAAEGCNTRPPQMKPRVPWTIEGHVTPASLNRLGRVERSAFRDIWRAWHQHDGTTYG